MADTQTQDPGQDRPQQVTFAEGHRGPRYARKISKYASENPVELLAEAFVLYHNSHGMLRR